MDIFAEELINTFREEADELMTAWDLWCLSLENDFSSDGFNEIFWIDHTLKVSSKTVGLNEFGLFVNQIEYLFKDIKESPPPDHGY